MNRLLVLLVAFLASAVAFVPPMTARSLSAVAAPVTRSHVEMGRGDKRTAKGAPLRSSHASAASSAASAASPCPLQASARQRALATHALATVSSASALPRTPSEGLARLPRRSSSFSCAGHQLCTTAVPPLS